MTNNSLTPTQRFWKLLKPDKSEITNVYVYSIFNGLVMLSMPLGIQAIIGLIEGGQVSTSFIVLVFLVVLGVAITGTLQIFQLRIMETLQQKIFTRAAFEFAFRLPRIKMEELYRHHAPELMNRFFDTVSVQKGLSKILIDFSSAALQIAFGLILLSLYHPFFILFGLVLVILVYSIFKFTGRKGLATSLQESRFKYRVAHWLEELARAHTTFKLTGNSDLALQKTDGQVSHYLNAREDHFKVLVNQYSMIVLFKVLVATGLLAIGGILVMDQRMNIGQFVAAEIIILMIMSSVEKLVLTLETIYDVLTSLEKIGQVTDLELESYKGLDLQELCPEPGLAVELRNVHFTYPNHPRKTLIDLSLKIQPGERILIKGQNGSGRSTLLHILAGLYDIQEGNLTYNGFPKSGLQPDSVRKQIGYCLSKGLIFEGSIMENIAMGREVADFKNVMWAVENLKLDEFINNLPDGLETILDPEGKRLPRSIVQKILLARSIVDRPKLLLLEDTFEHLQESEKKDIIEFITSDKNEWTLVAVSDDPYLSFKSDRVVIMESGSINGDGNKRKDKKVIVKKEKSHA